MRLKFHWSLSQVGDPLRRARATKEMPGLISLEAQLDFCRRAEGCGIDSVLMAFGFTRPDPLALSVALGRETEKIKFMVACRTGLFSPTFFVQQVNTASALIGGRIHINMVTGHTPEELRYYGDFLGHDERYERTDEFLTVCRSFWRHEGEVNFEGKHYRIEGGRLNTPFVSGEGSGPVIYLGGNSAQAEGLAVKHADCLWIFPDAPEKMRARVPGLVERGVEVGLLVSLISRPTTEEARHAASELVMRVGGSAKEFHNSFASKSDSVGFRSNYNLGSRPDSEWLTPTLWTGAIPYLGAPAIALVGSPAEIAAALSEYARLGVTQFLFMGWPDLDEMTFFGSEIRPLVERMADEESG
jgi:alkanesulfonate monooxygenase